MFVFDGPFEVTCVSTQPAGVGDDPSILVVGETYRATGTEYVGDEMTLTLEAIPGRYAAALFATPHTAISRRLQ